MSDNSSADINCVDGTTTNKIDAKWIYETGIEFTEILGSGSSFSSVATISNEDDAKEAYKKVAEIICYAINMIIPEELSNIVMDLIGNLINI